MISNAEIKLIRSLREKKFRDLSGMFTVEGEKMVGEAVSSGFKVEKIWKIEDIGREAMSRISSFSSPSPVLALVRKPEPEKGVEECRGLCLALDSVRDPGNMGTIIRICDWFGIEKLFVSEDCVEIYNPKVIQSSMGSIFRVPVVTADIAETCRRFNAAGLPVYGTFLDGTDIYSNGLSGEGLIIMGNESNGICAAVEKEVNSRLRIPSYGNSGAESLNVAVATAVTVAEFRRRK